MPRNSITVSPKRRWIAKLARQSPPMAFTSLAYLMNLDWLREAFRQTRKDGAVGVDEQTADQYASNLEANLQSLLDRAKSGTYRAPPVRRVHIPKAGKPGETRPLGIPTFEDKVLQRAVLMLLEPIYEQDFHPGSFGFRPGRSAHHALDALWKQVMGQHGGWILEVDIRKFFDMLDHGHLRTLLQRRIRDGVLLRLIGKWLKAGVMEEGRYEQPETGTPQGGVISPLLANIFLHYVLDEWFEQEVKPRLSGTAFLIRYADDFVMGFALEADARRVLEVLPKRLAKFGLSIHPDKTRLVRFQRPSLDAPDRKKDRPNGPGTFALLGFTHYWGRSRRGKWIVKRKTERKRLSRSLRTITDWCKRHRHQPVREQHPTLRLKVQGHYAYYGVTGNSRALANFLYQVQRIWKKWLQRRNRRRDFGWAKFTRLLRRYSLPPPRIVHSVYHRVVKP